ncbi:hypothetical protein JTB14_037977 [Gonioctena quinquepunctata]|nr:hypothetical protein JTB14_037977 [Gonioctena quinquepunctata]
MGKIGGGQFTNIQLNPQEERLMASVGDGETPEMGLPEVAIQSIVFKNSTEIVNMDTRKPLHDNELADILTNEDFWVDEKITIEDEAGPSGSQCMSADDEMDATNIILLDGDESEQGESDLNCLVL